MFPYGYKQCLYDTEWYWKKTKTNIKNTLRAYKKRERNEGKREIRKERTTIYNDR